MKLTLLQFMFMVTVCHSLNCKAPCSCPSKTSIDCSGKLTSEIPSSFFADLTEVTKIDLSNNDLSIIDPDAFEENKKLTWLSLAGNPNLLLPDDKVFLNSNSLEVLDLSLCMLSNISSVAFNGVPNMKSLNLSGNSLVQFPRMSKKTKLSVLDVSGNNIVEMNDTALSVLPKGITLNLSRNNMSLLTIENAQILSKMPFVKLENNSWWCNCILQETFKWCVANNVTLNLTCGKPEIVNGKPWDILKKLECDIRLYVHNIPFQEETKTDQKEKSFLSQSPATMIFIGVFLAAMVVAIAYSVTKGRKLRIKRAEAAKSIGKHFQKAPMTMPA